MDGYPPPPPACPAYLTAAECAELQAVAAKPDIPPGTSWSIIIAMTLAIILAWLKVSGDEQ